MCTTNMVLLWVEVAMKTVRDTEVDGGDDCRMGRLKEHGVVMSEV